MNCIRYIQMLSLAGVLVWTAGCGSSTTEQETAAAAVPAELAAVFGVVEPSAAVSSIPALRDRVQPGDAVVLEAQVMGAARPFVDERALFVVGDEETITTCDLMGDKDHCQTPWDACCEDPKTIQAGTATIQVLDKTGQVMRYGLKGVNGLTELSRVRIAGTVAEQAAAGVLIVNADTIEIL